MKRVVIYLRKSRSDGEYESIEEVLARHEKQLQEYAIRFYGAKISEDNIYREVISGETIEDRPMMKKLLKSIENNEISAVIVIEPQRLSRGSFGDIDRIVNTFKYTDTKVITPTKTYDLNNKFDRKYFEQELLRGNEYLEYIKEILVRGRIRSVEDGYFIASVTPYGYDKIKTGKKGFTLIPNNEAENVKYIFNKFLQGLGTTNLAKHLNDIGMVSKKKKPWTADMVRNILSNDTYIGVLTYGRRATQKTIKDGKIVSSHPVTTDCITVKGLHEPLIDPDTFYKVQETIKFNKGRHIPKGKTLKNPLAGLIICKYCGATMKRRPYDRNITTNLICGTINCKNVSSSLELVEKRVIDLLQKELSNYKYYVSNYETKFNNTLGTINKKISSIDAELHSLQEDLRNALVKYNRNKITEEEYDFLRNYTLNEETRLNGLKIALNDELKNNEFDSKRKAIPIIEKCLNEYYTLSVEDKHSLLTSIIDYGIYEKTDTNGRWNEEARNNFTLELFLKI